MDNYTKAGDVLHDELMGASFENGGTTYVNLDACWGAMDTAALARQVDTLHARGQKAGIYGAPFAYFDKDVNAPIPGFEDHKWQEILLRDAQGELLPRVDGAIPMDLTHPLWKEQMLWQIKRFVDWGFDYVKFDFLSHGATEGVRYDKAVQTGRQAICLGYQTIADALSPERIGRPFFISLSIAPVFPAGFGHARRMSCDAFGHIEDTEYLLNALTYAWWQNDAIYAFNDPDHTTLYRSFENPEPLTVEEARARYTASAICGTVMMLSDDYGPEGDPQAHQAAIERAKLIATNARVNAVARIGKTFRPLREAGVDACQAFTMAHEGKRYLALFNYARQARQVGADLALAGFADCQTAVELWTGERHAISAGKISLTLAACDAALFELE